MAETVDCEWCAKPVLVDAEVCPFCQGRNSKQAAIKPAASPAQGWYADTEIAGGERWWDGSKWTDARREKPTSKPLKPIAAGWYDDPDMVNTSRYWDGQKWTEHRQAKTESSGWPKIVVRLAGVVLVLIVAWLTLGHGWQTVTGQGASVDISEVTDFVKLDLESKGVPVEGFTCDDPGDVQSGDFTYCRGTSKGTPVNVKVTFGRDGRVSYETQ